MANEQRQLRLDLTEGDLPLPQFNQLLGEARIDLPVGLEAGTHVTVHFSVSEEYVLSIEADIPSAARRTKGEFKFADATRAHLFDEIEDFITATGDQIRPEERAALQQSRVAVEDLSHEFRELEESGDFDRLWQCYERLQAEVTNLRRKMSDAQRKYA
jgi:hypothetical protein